MYICTCRYASVSNKKLLTVISCIHTYPLEVFLDQCRIELIADNDNIIQLDLFIKDTLRPANLSTVERLSTL